MPIPHTKPIQRVLTHLLDLTDAIIVSKSPALLSIAKYQINLFRDTLNSRTMQGLSDAITLRLHATIAQYSIIAGSDEKTFVPLDAVSKAYIILNPDRLSITGICSRLSCKANQATNTRFVHRRFYKLNGVSLRRSTPISLEPYPNIASTYDYPLEADAAARWAELLAGGRCSRSFAYDLDTRNNNRSPAGYGTPVQAGQPHQTPHQTPHQPPIGPVPLPRQPSLPQSAPAGSPAPFHTLADPYPVSTTLPDGLEPRPDMLAGLQPRLDISGKSEIQLSLAENDSAGPDRSLDQTLDYDEYDPRS